MEFLTSTEVARRLSDVLNRVRYQDESFVITRGGEQIALLTKTAVPGASLSAVVSVAVKHLSGDPGFADDLDSIQRDQQTPGGDPWAS